MKRAYRVRVIVEEVVENQGVEEVQDIDCGTVLETGDRLEAIRKLDDIVIYN
jgi:hypothetical protein